MISTKKPLHLLGENQRQPSTPADINLALGKPATQSSNYDTTLYHASQAVNGSTEGTWYNNSITHTQNEQGAWWQVDLER
jgi:hypothetical protein